MSNHLNILRYKTYVFLVIIKSAATQLQISGCYYIWNSIPKEIQKLTTTTFKKEIKTLLY